MPVTHFEVRWPDQTTSTCYSPSSVVRESFAPGTRYPLDDFLARADVALKRASGRVAEKYGSPCSLALGQLASLYERAKDYEAMPNASVELVRFL